MLSARSSTVNLQGGVGAPLTFWYGARVQTIDVYTDGGCHGNPGPGAWAFVIQGGFSAEEAGADLATTNNRMELQAVIEALRYLTRHRNAVAAVRIHTDSQYVKNGINEWIHTWIRNGWRTAAKRPVKNQDLWIRLHELNQLVQPSWVWVRGHAGNELNERCDALVQEYIGRIEQQIT